MLLKIIGNCPGHSPYTEEHLLNDLGTQADPEEQVGKDRTPHGLVFSIGTNCLQSTIKYKHTIEIICFTILITKIKSNLQLLIPIIMVYKRWY